MGPDTALVFHKHSDQWLWSKNLHEIRLLFCGHILLEKMSDLEKSLNVGQKNVTQSKSKLFDFNLAMMCNQYTPLNTDLPNFIILLVYLPRVGKP